MSCWLSCFGHDLYTHTRQSVPNTTPSFVTLCVFRLRHEKMKPIPEDRGGPSEYRMLKCYELEATPQPKPPKLRTNKDDPFDFYSGEAVEIYD